MSAPSDLHSAWSRLFVRALRDAGVARLVVSPGSRSTPLVLAAAAEPGLECDVALDERAAAFYALGQVRASGAPVALLCTSGTAGAHYLPAVIEASQSRLPLVVVTADRPWEAYDVAAPQTIDQVKLYGGHVRHYAELGLPDPSPTALRAAMRVAAQAVARARGPVPGPVHVNARFRKPLEPVDPGGPEAFEADVAALLARGAPRSFASVAVPEASAVVALAEACGRAERGLIVCGPAVGAVDVGDARASVAALAEATGYPVLAEATSQLRFGAGFLGGFDAWMRAPDARAALAAEIVIELGAPPTSAGYASYLAAQPPRERWVLARDGWHDPASDASAMVFGDPYATAARVAAALGERARARAGTVEFGAAVARAEAAVWRAVAAEVELPTLTEGRIAHLLLEALPPGSALLVGNSNPVRDLDLYGPPGGSFVRVLHQRGASGIDGMVAGAAGARRASDAGAVVLFTGDLGMAHDLSALALARQATRSLVLLVVQNGGGRIFEQLPVGQAIADRDTFERYFATPQALDLGAAATAYGVRYARADAPAALRAALAQALAHQGCTVLEAVVVPGEATARRAAIYAAARRGCAS